MIEGEKHKKSKGKPQGKVDKTDKTATEGAIMDERRECPGGRSQNTATVDMEGNIAAIREDIRNMAREMKSELGIREEIKQKLGEAVTDLKATTDRVGEA